MKTQNRSDSKNGGMPLWQNPWVIGVFFVGLNAVVGYLLITVFDHDPAKAVTWQLAKANQLPLDAEYSPLPSLITQFWQYLFGDGSLSAFSYNSFFYGLSLLMILAVAQNIFNNSAVSRLSIYLTMLSPYLAWSIYVGREVAMDVFGVSVLILFASRIYLNFTLNNLIAFALAGSLATSFRESTLAVFFALLLFFWLRGVLKTRRLFLASAVFILGISPLLVWNFSQTRAIILSTRFGQNLYLGNHPFYLEGHPKYDIDVFLSQRVSQEINFPDTVTPIERDKAYRQLAFASVAERPSEALQRLILKSLWWIGPTRVPESDLRAYLHPENDIIIIEGDKSTEKELLYTLHRSLILLAVLAYWKQPSFHWEKALFLLLPMLAVMPIVLATFPDTRFRLAYDPYIHMLAAAGLVNLGAQFRQKKKGGE